MHSLAASKLIFLDGKITTGKIITFLRVSFLLLKLTYISPLGFGGPQITRKFFFFLNKTFGLLSSLNSSSTFAHESQECFRQKTGFPLLMI
jgi:hypothetical protein